VKPESRVALCVGKLWRKSRRELFLDEMEQVVPWSGLQPLVEPHYAKARNGRRPVGLGNVLRTYFVQQCFNLSDPGVEETLWGAGDSLGLDLGIAPSPDETTIGRFRHLLEKHDLGSLLASANSSSTHYQKALSPVFGLLEPVPYCISRSRTSSQVRAIPCSRANLGRHPSPCSFDTSISF